MQPEIDWRIINQIVKLLFVFQKFNFLMLTNNLMTITRQSLNSTQIK